MVKRIKPVDHLELSPFMVKMLNNRHFHFFKFCYVDSFRRDQGMHS